MIFHLLGFVILLYCFGFGTTQEVQDIPKNECIEERIDYHGGKQDIGYIGNIESSLDCACTCKERAECKFFTWNAAKNLCILKSADGGRRPYSQAYSGSEDCCVSKPEDYCPCGWIKNGEQCYKYFETTSTRSVAKVMCEREGGNLVSIHSPEENNFVHQLSMCTEEDFWIGSHDKDSDRSWEWTDSSPWTFANWARVEHIGDWWLQNCGHMFAKDGKLNGRTYRGGEWHIVECANKYNFVCEQPVSNKSRDEPCNTTVTLCIPTPSSTSTRSTITTSEITTTITTKTTTTTTTTTKTTTTTTKTKTTPSSTTTNTYISTSSAYTTSSLSPSTSPSDQCHFTYNRICALRVDYCAERNDTTGKDAILTYDQQMFTSDDLQNNNFLDGKYTAQETGDYAVNFWTKGFTNEGKVELYHNDKKIEWDQQSVNDQYHADVSLSAGDILYIWVSGMDHCWADEGAWHLLNSVLCVEPVATTTTTTLPPQTTTVEECAVLYEGENLTGKFLPITGEQSNFFDAGMNDKISSFEIKSVFCKVTLYTHTGFQGPSITFTGHGKKKLPSSWDKHVSSAKCACTQGTIEKITELLPRTTTTKEGCPDGWTFFGTNCYKLNADILDRNAAEKHCNLYGGHLASIHSKEENNFVSSIDSESFWVGGTYDSTQQTWMWTDGSPMKFRSWYPSLPIGDGPCMITNWGGAGLWNNRPCEIIKNFPEKFLCKKSIFPHSVSVATEVTRTKQTTTLQVDGSWSAWGLWGACNRKTGKKERKRTCTNPEPLNGGKSCMGPDKDEESCPGINCLWTNAKRACIAGENARSVTDVATMEDCVDLCKKEKSFICVSVDYSAREKLCHMSTMTSKTATSLGKFYEPCHYPDFLFAEWQPSLKCFDLEEISTKTGTGSGGTNDKVGVVLCNESGDCCSTVLDDPDVLDRQSESIDNYTGPGELGDCFNFQLGEVGVSLTVVKTEGCDSWYVEWVKVKNKKGASLTCTFEGRIDNNGCGSNGHPKKRTASCRKKPSVHGNWGSWESWSICDCKTGKKKRTRKCDSPAPLNGGDPCLGLSMEEPLNCPVNVPWGSHSSGTGLPHRDESFCTDSHPCCEKQGDCDTDSQCQGDLICGINNCKRFNQLANWNSDCCVKPAK